MISKHYNSSFMEFKRYEHEIVLGVYESILKRESIDFLNTLENLGENEIHYIIKYHYKIFLNAFFFQDKSILLSYHEWIYRVYYYKNINLDFFKSFNQLFLKVIYGYLNSKNLLLVDEYFNYILQEHEYLVTNSLKKKNLLVHQEDVGLFVKSLIEGDEKKTLNIIQNRVENIDQFLCFFDEVIANAMTKIGYMWETGEVSVAKEHIASNTLISTLMHVLDTYNNQKEKNIHIVLSTAPSELHGLGVQVASQVLQKLGYKVTNLGCNIPSKEIKKAIMEFAPDIIIFTATLQTSLLDIALLVDEIIFDKSMYVKEFKIGIAGNAFSNLFHPVKTLKVDFYIRNLQGILDNTILGG